MKIRAAALGVLAAACAFGCESQPKPASKPQAVNQSQQVGPTDAEQLERQREYQLIQEQQRQHRAQQSQQRNLSR